MRGLLPGLVACGLLAAGCSPSPPRVDTARSQQVAAFSEMNAIIESFRDQMNHCWEPPRMNFREVPVVRLRVVLGPDGDVRSVTILDVRGRTVTPFLLSVANHARDAVRLCSPYNLPGDKYELWSDFVLAFEVRPPR